MIGMNRVWAPIGVGYLLSLAAAGVVFAQNTNSEAQAGDRVATQPVAEDAVYALVNGKPILRKEFHSIFSNDLRQKFYHGQVTEERLEASRKTVTDTLVERILLLEEAGRRGLVADPERVAKTIAEYDARYAGRPNWQQNRETLLPGLRKELSERDLLEQVEKATRGVPEASEEEVRKFYEARKDLFTEPEKMRIHAILLKVDPSSAPAVWAAALEEAKGIVRRLRAGANFEDEARVKSNDESGERGGDMGYMHLGMLPQALQAHISDYKPGEIRDPVEVLQGVGIFRLDERVPAQLRSFDEVKKRARELLNRERADQAWADLRARLRQAATVKIVEEVRFVSPNLGTPKQDTTAAGSAPVPATGAK